MTNERAGFSDGILEVFHLIDLGIVAFMTELCGNDSDDNSSYLCCYFNNILYTQIWNAKLLFAIPLLYGMQLSHKCIGLVNLWDHKMLLIIR